MGRKRIPDAKVRRVLGRKWISMMQRCYNADHPRYKLYGGSGVVVCKRWHDKETFMEDAKSLIGYDETALLDGILYLDKDAVAQRNMYSPKYCKFISIEESNKHKPNQMLEFIGFSPDGKKYKGRNQSEFALLHSLRQSSISECLRGKIMKHRGWTFEYAK